MRALLAIALTATLLPIAVLADITGKPRVIDGTPSLEVAAFKARAHPRQPGVDPARP